MVPPGWHVEAGGARVERAPWRMMGVGWDPLGGGRIFFFNGILVGMFGIFGISFGFSDDLFFLYFFFGLELDGWGYLLGFGI